MKTPAVLKRRVCQRIVVLISVVLLAAISSTAGAGGVQILFKSGGELYIATVPNAAESFSTTDSDEDYDGHKTSADNKFNHSHNTKNFPQTVSVQKKVDGVPQTSNGQPVIISVNVSAGMADAFTTTIRPDATIVTTATFSKNCHGYTTTRSYWVAADEEGMGIVELDEWQAVVFPYRAIIYMYDENLHSYKFFYGDPCAGTDNHTREKNGAGPVYQEDDYYRDADIYPLRRK